MFAQAGFTLKQLGPPTPVMFFNETAGEIGLQFFDAGLQITLPDRSSNAANLPETGIEAVAGVRRMEKSARYRHKA